MDRYSLGGTPLGRVNQANSSTVILLTSGGTTTCIVLFTAKMERSWMDDDRWVRVTAQVCRSMLQEEKEDGRVVVDPTTALDLLPLPHLLPPGCGGCAIGMV
jgi:hypothetical protein